MCLCVMVQVHVEVRLALPVVEVYKLFLQRHPEEKARIDKVGRQAGRQLVTTRSTAGC